MENFFIAKFTDFIIVIIINNKADSFGFPSTILEPPIMKYLLEKDDSYPLSEERRLFYVGLTRARKKVWILYVWMSFTS